MNSKNDKTNSDELDENTNKNIDDNLSMNDFEEEEHNDLLDESDDDFELIDDLDDEDDPIDIDENSELDHSGSNAEHSHKKAKRSSLGNIIRYVILAIAAIVFLYSGFMLVKIYLDYKKGDDIYKSIADSVLVPVEPTTSDEGVDDSQLPFKYDHQALLNINPEGVGYLYIPSISVRLPIVQGTDNDYYLTHTFNRTSNGAGALFEDYRINNGLSASHVIIYGHNMKNGSMFGGLLKYLTPSFYQATGNDKFYIYTENKLLEYKIFSVYISEPVSDTYTFNFTNVSALRTYAESMKELSSYNTGVDVSSATQVVTFSTCTGDGEQRVIVQGTFINESPLE